MQLYVLSEAPGSIHEYIASVTVSVHTFCLINPKTFSKNYVKLFLGSLVGMGRMACFCSSAIAENTRMRVYRLSCDVRNFIHGSPERPSLRTLHYKVSLLLVSQRDHGAATLSRIL